MASEGIGDKRRTRNISTPCPRFGKICWSGMIGRKRTADFADQAGANYGALTGMLSGRLNQIDVWDRKSPRKVWKW